MDDSILAIVFKIANAIVMPQWILMIVLPSHKWTNWLLKTMVFPLSLAVLYFCLIAYSFTNPAESGGNFSSLEGVKKLFENPIALLAGWIHYLAFDLMVGRYILLDAKTYSYNKIIVGICLFFTLMLGPVGFLGYTLYKKLLHSKN